MSNMNSPEKAIESYDKALEKYPDHAEVWNDRGVALHKLRRYVDAIQSFDRALAARPDHAVALSNRGAALLALHRHEDALANYERALAANPDDAEAHYNRGIALARLNRQDEAVASYERALAIRPSHVNAWNNRGNALAMLGRHDEAIASYDKALAIDRDHANAWNNRGNVLYTCNRHEDAITCYERSLRLKPGQVGALNNLGNAHRALKRFDKAIAAFEKALEINPRDLEALNNLANVCRDSGRFEQAISGFERILEIKPDYPFALGALAHMQALMCDWNRRDITESRVISGVRSGKLVTLPLPLLALSDSSADQLTCARTFIADKYPAAPLPGRKPRTRNGRLRVAYVSADFRNHAVAFLIAELIERHDRNEFETIGISLGAADSGEMRSRFVNSFEQFIEVSANSDEQVVTLLRDAGAHIAVDLMGFTRDARTGIFARRAAPIQVNYLGYPGTMGAGYIDYILADRFVIPAEEQVHYAEKVAYLPECFQVNDSKRRIAEKTPTRAEAGLPEGGFVFCCFNNSYKLSPRMFDVWMRLLQMVPGSVLWLAKSRTAMVENLRREAQERGVDPKRLVFAPRVKLDAYLAQYRIADLFLDTLPFNAGTTASDALWAGLPVLTCAGEAFAARMAGSLLNAIGLQELVTHTLQDYEALALKLATHPEELRAIREKLARNRLTTPLFDTDRFRRHIEAAYKTMWEIYQRGEPPRSFAVDPISTQPLAGPRKSG